MEVPPLTDTDIEGDLQAIMQALSAIIRTMEPAQATAVAMMLQEVRKNAKSMEGKSERLDKVLKRMIDGINVFGHDAVEAAKRTGSNSPKH